LVDLNSNQFIGELIIHEHIYQLAELFFSANCTQHYFQFWSIPQAWAWGTE